MIAAQTRWQRWLPFTAILSLATFLRLFRLGTQSLWLDEAFSLILAQQGWSSIIANTARDTMPPLYYLLLHPFLSVNNSEASGRLLSALLGILTIPVIWSLGRRLFGRRVALLSALLLAINPFHIYYSQEARMYSQLGLFGLLAALCFFAAWQEGQARYWAVFVLSATATLYTHNTAFLLFLALGFFALLHWRQAWQRRKELALSLTGIAVLFLPWAARLPGQVGRVGGGFWLEAPPILKLLTTLALFLFGYALPPALSVAALIVALFAVFATALISWRVLREGTADRLALTFLLCLFFVPLLSSYLISLVYPIYLARTLMISALALLLLVAWGLTRIPHPVALLLALAGLALIGTSLFNYYANPDYAKPPLREAAAYVAAHYQPGDTILHISDSSYLTFAYYQPQLERHFPVGDPDYEQGTTRGRSGRLAGIEPETIVEITRDRQRLWLAVTLDHNFEHQREVKQRLDDCYPLLEHTQIGGIYLLLYDLRSGGKTCR